MVAANSVKARAADIKDRSSASVRPVAEVSFRERWELYHISDTKRDGFRARIRQYEPLKRDLESRDQSHHRHDHALWEACRPHCANQAEESTRFNKPSTTRRTKARA